VKLTYGDLQSGRWGGLGCEGDVPLYPVLEADRLADIMAGVIVGIKHLCEELSVPKCASHIPYEMHAGI